MPKPKVETIRAGDKTVAGLITSYLRVPEYLREDSELGPAEKLVYAVLLKYTEIGHKHGKGAFPGLATIARECGASEDSVTRWITKLSLRGWVTVERRGLGRTNVYSIHGPHEKCESVGSGIKPDLLRQEISTRKLRILETADCGIKNPQNADSGNRKLRNQETADCASITMSTEQDETQQHENKHHPQPPLRGRKDGVCSSSDDSAPTPQKPQRTRRQSRYARESDHEFWQGDHGAAHLQRFNYLWAKCPRQEARLEAMRAWREVLGDDALDNDLMRVILKTFEEATWNWASYTTGMEPLLSTWLTRRDWEEASEYKQLGADAPWLADTEEEGW